MSRLVASEGMVEQLTTQVIDLRSKVLVSAGKLKNDEGHLLLDQIEVQLDLQQCVCTCVCCRRACKRWMVRGEEMRMPIILRIWA